MLKRLHNLVFLLVSLLVALIISVLVGSRGQNLLFSEVKAQSGTGTINVNPGGSDSIGCGSAASPCKTISFAVGQAVNGDDIIVAAGTYKEKIRVEQKRVRLLGAGQGASIIEGQKVRGPLIFFVNTPAGTEVRGFTVQNGVATDGAGLNLFQSSVLIQDLTVISNTATGLGGGGLRLNKSTATINNVVVERNQATATPNGSGGGFYISENSSVTMLNVVVQNNTAVRQGGGLVLDRSSNVSLEQISVKNNKAGVPVSSGLAAGDAGGGIYFYQSSPSLKDSLIEGNIAGKQGGGLFISVSSSPTLQNVTIRNNAANGSLLGGGGIYIFQGAPTILNSLIEKNSGKDGGGGIWVEESSLNLQNSVVQNNSVPGTNDGGGGLYTYQSSISIVNTTIQSNTASSNVGGGGGGLHLQSTTGTLNHIIVANNTANQRGGGFIIRNDSSRNISNIILLDSSVINNRAKDGGGFFVTDSTATLQHSTISNNKATNDGGAVNMQYSGLANPTLVIEDNKIENNSAASDGGGFFLGGANTNLTLKQSEVMSNVATAGDGGGLFLANKPKMNLTNNFIGFNHAGQRGGGIFNISTTSSTIVHTTIARNTSSSGGGGLHCELGSHTLANLILWNNSPGNLLSGGTCSAGANALTTDPKFVNEAGGDFHLTSNSPAINAGSNRGVTTDIDGQLRNTPPDIGADEALTDVTIIKKGIKVGNAVTYTLTFANQGSLTATGVQIVDTIPAGLANPNVSNSGATINKISGPPNYRWQVQNLTLGESGIITITGTYSGSDSFANTATIQASTEFDTSNNSSTVVLPRKLNFLPIILK